MSSLLDKGGSFKVGKEMDSSRVVRGKMGDDIGALGPVKDFGFPAPCSGEPCMSLEQRVERVRLWLLRGNELEQGKSISRETSQGGVQFSSGAKVWHELV